MGLNIMLPFEQSANPVIAGDPKLVHMKYFFTRKLMFVKECDAVVCLPGGFGTLDEGARGAHAAADRQARHGAGRVPRRAGRRLLAAVAASSSTSSCWPSGMISPEDLSLYKLTDSVDEAVRRDPAVLPRLPQHAVREEQARAAAERAAAERAAGRASTRSSPTSWPKASSPSAARCRTRRTSPTWPTLPRLVFHFNRRSLGRLRQLIDAINRGGVQADR